MPKEKEDFRELLARLSERFPLTECITLQDAAKVCGCSLITLKRSNTFPKVRVGRCVKVPLVGLARYLSTR